MLDEIGNFFNIYLDLISEYPIWITILFIVLHIVTLIICFSFNKKDSDKSKTNSSLNTLHTYLWALIIIICPVFGIILYFLGSVLPYSIWKKKTGKTTNPFSVKVGDFSWKSFIGIIGITMIINGILKMDGKEIYDNLHGIAMGLCFLNIADDFFINFKNKSIFLKIIYADSIYDTTEVKPFFDKKHFIEKSISEPDNGNVVSSIARSVGDFIIPDNRVPNSNRMKLFPPNIDFYYDKHKVEYAYLYKNNEFKKLQADVIDAEYIGKGVTKYTVASWSEDECIEQTIFNVSPKPLYFLFSSAVLFASYFLVFSPYVADFNIKLISFLDKLLGGLK